MSDRPTVVIAMSGGVDSSVAAALLVEQGYRVIGMMLRLWSECGQEESNRCCTPDSMLRARRVAAILGIPFYVIDGQEKFRVSVVEQFLDDLSAGVTPNPCIVCNRLVRWGFLLDQAKAAGAEFMATGHYARLRQDANGQVELLRGLDARKDQSYVLSVLTQAQLQHSIFPLGELDKPYVREIARKYQLPAAEEPDSQDLCFLGDQDYREFVKKYRPQSLQDGPILNQKGEKLGNHHGLALYTIGQRKGLGIASPKPLYVITKDVQNNALIIGEEGDLGRDQLLAGNVNWISGRIPEAPFEAQIKIRYKAVEASGQIIPNDAQHVSIAFHQMLRDITPGQRVVFYQGEVCLGGGTILA
jgi:tRNA-specific 2-thiouridylase